MQSVPKPIVNDFCITVSTINGSGSATANTTILRSLFRMGIPVSGKNIFPSNIQGLPTWYTIRVNKEGHVARMEKDDIVIAMNPATFSKEQEYVVPGGVLFYADDIKAPIQRDDIVTYPMPVKKMIKEADVPAKLRDYIANMVYVGVLAQIIGIDIEQVRQALEYHFKGKQSAVESNLNVVKAAADWAAANLEKRDPYLVEAMHATQGKIMTDGNTAAALGAIYGGVQFVGWYPITPASSLVESIQEFLPTLRKDPVTGKNTCAVVQAEDEIAAIGMAVGAGWSGLRSMTSTSGPGFSLMSEYPGLAHFSETPIVVWDVQRVGPSTGLPTRTAQADLTYAYFDGHGDTKYILLLPGSVKECFEFGWRAFDLAERFQTPVIVLSDLDLGMNQWMSDPFEYPDMPMDRGKVLWENELEEMLLKNNGQWGRYLDVDGDGIPYRTLPGNRHPRAAFFTRGTGHDEFARYSEEPEVWERLNRRIMTKYENARWAVPAPVLERMPGATAGIIAFGSTDPAVKEARALLNGAGIPTDYLRIRSTPFNGEVKEFIQSHSQVYVVENNRDGQLKQLLTLEYPSLATRMHMVAHLDGLPLTAQWIKEKIANLEAK
ncbi:MAG: 2-oxoacid:acceptor oxidoreductase subunit alpha [Chloroflexi bacterium]|nr:2-oxoacid:acceptor oxidoreductase subunit alpha [Chloroflexota bacterium]